MKSGQFSLQVINAETREPMKEFQCPEGKLYVEAEPDVSTCTVMFISDLLFCQTMTLTYLLHFLSLLCLHTTMSSPQLEYFLRIQTDRSVGGVLTSKCY